MSVQQVFDPALQENPVPQNDFTMFQNISVATSTATLAATNEFDQYLSEPTEPTTDPMKWWWNRRHRYPALSTNALDFHSIPATSTASEPLPTIDSRASPSGTYSVSRTAVGIILWFIRIWAIRASRRLIALGKPIKLRYTLHIPLSDTLERYNLRVTRGLGPEPLCTLGGVGLHGNVVGNVPSRNKPAVIPVLASRSVTPTIKLFEEQQMAYNIVTNHVLATKDDRNPEQLLMLLLGFGGTGKTVTINTISQMFRQNNVNNWITVIATSGVATTLIQGVTVHFWGGIHVTDKTKRHEDPDVLVMKMSAVEIR
ncbi:hypothetical protein C8J56DRAFT_898991 [Mycena floridula]|nr:hypothetical protein C8J56DRAFT_898991 [Mycena floridula]